MTEKYPPALNSQSFQVGSPESTVSFLLSNLVSYFFQFIHPKVLFLSYFPIWSATSFNSAAEIFWLFAKNATKSL